ncbi:MAG TPA: extensin family protein, partial [Polyangiales bacterium]|nr:extensin family protein [Polyangiales bacterium]
IVLHGGSANGNLFLGVVLGNNMNWKEYEFHLWDEFEPRWASNFIMVAPDGFGQVMWRFMGEQDVLDVIADVERNYKVDDDRVVLLGLSNGGVGAYNMGLRHASRFAAVLAIAGCPSWTQYAGRVDAFQTEALKPQSGMWIAENMIDTDFRFFHGHEDPGPMRPAFVEEFSKHIATLGVPYKEKWYDAGHDLLYLVLQYGGLFKKLENVTRNRHPKEVRVVTGDYRAAQQHWVTVTGIERFPSLARVKAVADGTRLRVETSNTRSLTIALSDVPLTAADGVSLEVDGQVVYDGARAKLGTSVVLSRGQDGRWQVGSAAQSASSGSNPPLAKKPGVSGPITDAYFGSMLHVYGTSVPAQTEALKKAAQRGARGWPVWLWRVEQPVVADSEVTEAMMREHHLVLYGTPGSNSILSRIEAKLPIHVDADGVVVGDRRFSSKGVGTRFIYPNPLAPDHYVIVQAAPTPEGVMNGHNLPDFLPDYVVYDQRTTRERPRLVFDLGHTPLLLGSFDEAWRLDPSRARSASPQQAPRKPAAIPEGNDPESAAHDRSHSHLPVSPAPPVPPAPTTFATNAASPTGKTAREIARRVQTFTNYRSKIPGATWTLDDTSRWSIREPEACLKQLEELGVHAKAWTRPLSTPVAVPVRIEGKVDDVEFRMMHAAAGGVVSCELAAHLPEIARIVKAHGVHTVHVLSAYRDHPYTSFHTLGLALDLAEFDTDRGPLIVKTDFIIDHEHETCDGPEPANDKARTLRAIACDLAATHHFSSVLTPNYNVGHRDHFHLDVRPDDPRLFLR